jgi:mRNA-degrading endonuclease toxin of MazEF toxin-antitoxin module
VLPITSNVSRVYAFEVLLSPKAGGLSKPSKAQAQQIRTISKERLRGSPLGRLNPALMRKAEDAMRFTLISKRARRRVGECAYNLANSGVVSQRVTAVGC